MVNTSTKGETAMSENIYKIIERLAEMFPQQDYQSRLEQFIVSRNPQSPADVDHWERQFNYNQGWNKQ